MRGLSLVTASGGHSSSRCAGLSLSRPLLLRSTGSRRAGSVIVAHGPSCSAGWGIFPDPGSNPCPLHWLADSQPLRHQGSPRFYSLSLNCSVPPPRPAFWWEWRWRREWGRGIYTKGLMCFYTYMYRIRTFFFFIKSILFLKNIFIFGCVVSSLLRADFLSSCGERGLLFFRCAGFSLRWLLLLRSMGSRHTGSVVVACGL